MNRLSNTTEAGLWAVAILVLGLMIAIGFFVGGGQPV